MDSLINSFLVSATKERVRKDTLTFFFHKSISEREKERYTRVLERIDSEIGLKFKILDKRYPRTDVVIKYTSPFDDNVPFSALGWAKWNDKRWSINLNSRYITPKYKTKKTFTHEVGHVLGLEHNDIGGLMEPYERDQSRWFNQSELNALVSTWGENY